MNILMLSYEFPPLGGGGSRVVYGLAKSLVNLGVQIDLVTMGYRGLPRRERAEGIEVHRVHCVRNNVAFCTAPEMLTYIVSALPYAHRLMRNQTYDLNHTHFIYPDGIVADILEHLRGLPYMITAHGSDVPGYNPDRFIRMHQWLKPVWRKITGRASRIICPSRNLQDLVLRSNPEARLALIPNGIDVDKFSPLEKKKRRILIVTRMLERKGIRYVLKALHGMEKTHEVNIVGGGPAFRSYVRLAAELDLDVKFRGWLDNNSSDLKDLFESSSIFVLPSESENFPISILEAMAAGMAIITTAGTGCEEVVGDTGILVPPRDSAAIRTALAELTHNDEQVKKLGIAARRRVEECFSWETVSKQYLAAYSDCLKSRERVA